jgi:hypothetical protein
VGYYTFYNLNVIDSDKDMLELEDIIGDLRKTNENAEYAFDEQGNANGNPLQ